MSYTPNFFFLFTIVIVKTILLTIKSWFLFFVPHRFRSISVANKVVLITGAGSGVGASLSIRFAKRKAYLVLLDLSDDGLRRTKKECIKYQSESCIQTFNVDISKREQVMKVAEEIKSSIGSVDILINNAGIVSGKGILEVDQNTFTKVMNVNVASHFWTLQAFLPDMIARNSGHIVSMASLGGMFGAHKLADYCASKFAAVGFQECLQNEIHYIRKKGIHILTVCPFFINTGMFDGVQSHSPLLPILKQEYAASRIEEAILIKSKLLIIPRMGYLLYMLKGILPTDALFALSDFAGINKCMDTYTGRKND